MTLAAGSSNTIYVTQAVSVLGLTSGVTFDIIVADSASEQATVTMRGSVTIT